MKNTLGYVMKSVLIHICLFFSGYVLGALLGVVPAICLILGAFTVYSLGMYFLESWIIYMPFLVQNLAYTQWQKNVKRKAKNVNPLIHFPFVVYIDIENRKIFEKEGIIAAWDDVHKWFDRSRKNIDRSYEDYKNFGKQKSAVTEN